MKNAQSKYAGRRPKGSGSFWYSASEKRWRATYRDADGQRRTLSAGSKAEIMQRLGEVQYGSTRASGRQRKPPATTLSSWLDEWLKRQTTLQPSTLRRYALDVRQHISPLMGELRVSDVTPQDIHEWLTAIQSRGLSPTSARHSLAVLRSALADAQRRGVVDVNPAQIVQPPRKAVSVAGSMTRAEVSAVLSAAREQGEVSELRWRLALIWGLRQGEALGLQWQDFDQAREAIAIKRSLAYVPGEGLQFYAPKTAASVRWVPLDDRTMQLMSRRSREPSEIVRTRTVFLTRT
ncbi:site-specific integrase, partial [bacterium]|nr:site-specific integrase [bacterium]